MNDLNIKTLIYRSVHRGCKEIDYLLGDFATSELGNLSDEELLQYSELLKVDDNLLYNWFNGMIAIPPEYNNSVINKIIKYNAQRFTTS